MSQRKQSKGHLTRMSYDLTIKSDDRYSKHADVEEVKAFIRQIPNISANGERGFCYQDGELYYMEIDLDAVDDEGDSVEEEDSLPSRINCIDGHIPNAFMDEDKADPNRYVEVLGQIAQHLGWYLYDPQEDEYLYEP
ncbi:MAG TPA: hypothetical protein VFD58_02875 [Blastocatellia bacterium]|nr:hypothetical protein [Blastocatellia bacterium]